MRGDAPRGSSVTAADRWPALADAFDGALPVLYRYVYSGTGGDAGLTEELTEATFVAAARGFAAGDDDRMALGRLHDAARDALARRAVRDRAGGRPSAPGRGDGNGDGAALRRLPFRQRVALALRFHDHLPVEEIAASLGTDPPGAERAVREATSAFLATAGGGRSDATNGATDVDERLYGLFASLDARPGDAYAARLRERLRAVVRATPAVRAHRPPLAAPAITVVPEVAPVAPVRPADRGRPAGHRPSPDPDNAGELVWEGPLAAPSSLGSTGRAARVRTGRPRAWGLPAVIVTAAVLVIAVVAGGGGRDGNDPAAAPPSPSATPGEGRPRAAGAPEHGAAARLVDAVRLEPAPVVGGERPAPITTAEVVRRVRLGPGGPYMNGPFALDAGDEGLWAAAVGDDGTWQAVRVDPATGETLARIRIPGRIPSDRSHHGIAVSGGYVWTPALRDGIFRIDASTNAPSGIVAVAGGVVGAAMDGGDGAVWAVGHDSYLRRIDARTTDITALALVPELGLMPTGVDVAYGRGTVWVSVADGSVRHLIGFDPVTLARRYHYALPALGLVSDAYDLAADGDRVVITESWPGGVTLVDGAAGRVVAQYRFATAGIAIDGDRAWILSPMDGQATVVWTRVGDLLGSAGVPPGVETMVPTDEGGVWAAIPTTGELVQLRFGG